MNRKDLLELFPVKKGFSGVEVRLVDAKHFVMIFWASPFEYQDPTRERARELWFVSCRLWKPFLCLFV